MNHPLLLPAPRTVVPREGTLTIHSSTLLLATDDAQSLLFTARRLQEAAASAGARLSLVASAGPTPPAVTLRVQPGVVTHHEGYHMEITPAGVVADAISPAGMFYAVATLRQLLGQYGASIPCMTIDDWPDFPHRGVMLDISRDKVPTLATTLMLVDMLADWKVNQFQLYTEHTFAYQHHPDVWAAASPFTPEDILTLDAYCRERFVELVPNQNSFGHMERWLKHPRYAPLAETTEGFTAWNTFFPQSATLTPSDPGSFALVQELYDELLPHFSSRQFNIGCDETLELGQGRSAADVAERGERVYLDFVRRLYDDVTRRGRTVQFWGDIIVERPDLIPELPRDIIALEWGYEDDHPFDERLGHFAASGIPFYACPGTSSWNSLGGRTTNVLGNLKNAARSGLSHGAIGYLNTDWGDNGHLQVLPISFLGFAMGAAYSWALDANRDLDVAQVISTHAFGDSSGAMGRAAYDLGLVPDMLGRKVHNSSLLTWVLLRRLPDLSAQLAAHPAAEGSSEMLSAAHFAAARAATDAALAQALHAPMQRPDAELIRQEYALATHLMRHACDRALFAMNAPEAPDAATLAADIDSLIGTYRTIWLARNRPGGLPDSLARLEQARADYGI